MAHPARRFCGHALEQLGFFRFYREFASAVLARTVTHRAAERSRYELTAVTNAEHGYAHSEDFRVDTRRVRLEEGRGSAREYNSDRVCFLYLLANFLERYEFAVHVCFAYSARYQLIVLSAEVDDEHRLLCHILSPCEFIPYSFATASPHNDAYTRFSRWRVYPNPKFWRVRAYARWRREGVFLCAGFWA